MTAAIALLTALLATASAHAQTFPLLHYFRGAEGTFPNAGLVRDAGGNLYGTAPYGGSYQNCDNENGEPSTEPGLGVPATADRGDDERKCCDR